MGESKVQSLKDAPVNSEVPGAPGRAAQTRPEPGGGPPGAVFPVSFAQESLWFIEQMAPGNAAYNMPEAWRLQGRLDARALEASVQQIIQRHETLRTVFGSNDG